MSVGIADSLAILRNIFPELSDSSDEGAQKLDPSKEGKSAEQCRLGRRIKPDGQSIELEYMTVVNGELLQDLINVQAEKKLLQEQNLQLQNELRTKTETLELLLSESGSRAAKKNRTRQPLKSRDVAVQTDGSYYPTQRWHEYSDD